ncbi:hypothetical protein DFH09DRAFT_1089596 [Mycena vulgaris]|nr:hypothetical protein DFH09DRAFT_1089596 [Mycena vulgaris]
MDSPSAEYDIIFAGGGTTACVVAGRLAAADRTLRILENRLMRSAEIFTAHRANPSVKFEGRAPVAAHASCVGGGSSVNSPSALHFIRYTRSLRELPIAMLYNRAPASDYDDGMRLGNPGWDLGISHRSQKRSLETFQAGVVDDTHGTSGPIKVSYGSYESKAGKDFLVAAAGFPRGRGFTEDLNDFSTCDVYGRIPKYIDAETGRRSDAAHCYVYNQAHNPNLRILDHARVNRVLFDGDRCASGIEYQVGGKDSEMLTARASRLVVVSAGAFCSPAILECSGLGGRALLEKHRIEVISDLPGVGQNYKGEFDHYVLMVPYLGPENEVTFYSLTRDNARESEDQWLLDGTGLMASTCFDTGIKLRPNAQELEQLGLLFRQRWEAFFADAPDKSPLFVGSWAVSGTVFNVSLHTHGHLGDPPLVGPGTIHSIVYNMMYPTATGHVHIQSADSFGLLEVETALLDMDADLVLMRWAYKWSRELARRMDNYRGEFIPGHPAFPADSRATCREAQGPVEMSAPEIQYSPADDEAIDKFHRAKGECSDSGSNGIRSHGICHAVGLSWHPLGTCAMKPREQSGVVDARLNVYGVKNLKVADMSIAPLNVALMIGEKAAILIAEELEIHGV